VQKRRGLKGSEPVKQGEKSKTLRVHKVFRSTTRKISATSRAWKREEKKGEK